MARGLVNMKHGTVYMIPSPIADNTHQQVISPQVRSILPTITHFLAEDVRTVRRYFSALGVFGSIEALHFEVLNKDTSSQELARLLQPVFEGHDIGIVSESGCPGVADPGALAVRYAHDHQVRVVPLAGPSSILLALMASGLNGQKFAFHGYLPIDRDARTKAIRELERESQKDHQTQLFIETPYRSEATLTALIATLRDTTLLTVAANLTASDEMVITRRIRDWKMAGYKPGKVPIVFCLLGE